MNNYLEIISAYKRNLKDLTLSIPLGKIIGITGHSGSGKSALCEGIIAAESKRRLLILNGESSNYTSRSREIKNLPLVKVVTPPLRVSIKQTMGIFLNLGRKIWNEFGSSRTIVCDICERDTTFNTVESLIQSLTSMYLNSSITIAVPSGDHSTDYWLQLGFTKGLKQGEKVVLEEETQIEEIIVDTFTIHKENDAQLIESVKTALSLGKDTFYVRGEKDSSWGIGFWCANCHRIQHDINPQIFNSPPPTNQPIKSKLGGVPIERILSNTFEALAKDFPESGTKELLSRINALLLGEHTFSTSLENLDSRERLLLSILKAEIPGIRGILYIFDEPFKFLLEADYLPIMQEFNRLIDNQNSVIVVSSDLPLFFKKVEIIDLGLYQKGMRDVSSKDFNKFSAEEDHSEESASTLSIKSITLEETIPVGKVFSLKHDSKDLEAILETFLKTKRTESWWKGTYEYSGVEALTKRQGTLGSLLGIFNELASIFAKSVEARTKGITAKKLLQLYEQKDPIIQSIKFKGVSLVEVVERTPKDLIELFGNVPKIAPVLQLLNEIGLTSVPLSRQFNDLSMGERSRLLIARTLMQRKTGALVVLLWPFVYLSCEDQDRLKACLSSFCARGNSVVII